MRDRFPKRSEFYGNVSLTNRLIGTFMRETIVRATIDDEQIPRIRWYILGRLAWVLCEFAHCDIRRVLRVNTRSHIQPLSDHT